MAESELPASLDWSEMSPWQPGETLGSAEAHGAAGPRHGGAARPRAGPGQLPGEAGAGPGPDPGGAGARPAEAAPLPVPGVLLAVLLHHLLLLLVEHKQPVVNVQLVVTEEAVALGTLSLPVLHEPELANSSVTSGQLHNS